MYVKDIASQRCEVFWETVYKYFCILNLKVTLQQLATKTSRWHWLELLTSVKVHELEYWKIFWGK